jgi:hypothetical protein
MVVGVDLRMIGMLLLWAILTRLDRRQCDIVVYVLFALVSYFFVVIDELRDQLIVRINQQMHNTCMTYCDID